MVISHTGREAVTSVQIEELTQSFTPIDKVAAIDIIHDRLAFGGIPSLINVEDFTVLEEAARYMRLGEKSTYQRESYSNLSMVSS